MEGLKSLVPSNLSGTDNERHYTLIKISVITEHVGQVIQKFKFIFLIIF